MSSKCPYCNAHKHSTSGRRNIIRLGRFWRKSDGHWVQRYKCVSCKKGFSSATFHRCYRQNKRHLNFKLFRLLSRGYSQRAAAEHLCISRTTVVRKLLFLALVAEKKLAHMNATSEKVVCMEFDDLETVEHTKLKPLSVITAVEVPTRRILGFEVAKMPAKGKLAALARKKYGKRPDQRMGARRKLLKSLVPFVDPRALIKSDESFHYPKDVKEVFPLCEHKTFKGRRGCVAGQGELKKIGFDPIFSINHTFAMKRANVNRLFRRTWNVSKKPERLRAHLFLYSYYHNLNLKKRVRSAFASHA